MIGPRSRTIWLIAGGAPLALVLGAATPGLWTAGLAWIVGVLALAGADALLAARRHRAPEEWLLRVERDGHAVTGEEALAPPDRMREALLMGLRLAEGVDIARLEARCAMPFGDAVDPAMLRACEEEGYLAWEGAGGGRRLRATAEGRLRLDAMLPVLLR